MSAVLRDSWSMTVRHMRNLARQPWWIAISLAQPLIWLTLYGQLFKRVVEIPGFEGGSYIDYLTPGVVVMTAVFSGGWSGMGVIYDLDRGILDRFLVTPTSRAALVAGRLAQQAITTLIQSLILVGLGLALGAGYPGGVVGIAVMLVFAMLLAAAFGALSYALALLLRREESVIAAANFVLLPVTFLSSVFLQPQLIPDWMEAGSRINPVDWAARAGRSALSDAPDWGSIGVHLLLLVAFTVVATAAAMRAFRVYQRSI